MSQIQSPPLRTRTAREDVNGWSSPEGEHGQVERACALDSGSGFWPSPAAGQLCGQGQVTWLLCWCLEPACIKCLICGTCTVDGSLCSVVTFAAISTWLHTGLLRRYSFSSPPLLAVSAPSSSAGC
ncbi:unnamed protein product [Rangifer tarandus platyrhynchus]|uniref:Uncharacterized protein n=2 Tax=Rangifer tarandus platyrhynchus TaxID=3082113 RepID=A0ABN8YD91_RANTA|nr:unnamed protein product [Rangifer tarandus platyrhynchus]